MTRNVVVLGGGPAGVNIALALMRPGFSTTIIEPDTDAADRAAFFLARLSGAARDVPKVSSDFGAMAQADIVFDAQDQGSPELPEQALLIRVGPANTQTQPQPIAIHLYAPIHLRRLVEVTLGTGTPAEMTQTVCDLIRDVGRVPVLAPGNRSIGARLTRCLSETADHLVLHGAIPHELDEAMVALGCDMGVYEAQDLIGLDVAYAHRNRSTNPTRPIELIPDRMIAEGRLGKKVGVGWYRYPGGGGAVIDPLIEDLIHEEARFTGIEPDVFTASDMQAQLVQALSDEVKAMLADGSAPGANVIALVLRHGLGFPDGMVAG